MSRMSASGMGSGLSFRVERWVKIASPSDMVSRSPSIRSILQFREPARYDRRASARGAGGPPRCDRYWRDRRGERSSALLPRPLPEADAAPEILPLALGTLVEGPAEGGAGRILDTRGEGVGQELH